MLMKMIATGAGTDEEYRKKLIGRIRLADLGIFLGLAATFEGAFMDKVLPETHQTSFLSCVYLGAGTAVALACGFYAVKMRRLLQDEKRLRSERIKESDERNKEIGKKATTAAMLINVYVIGAALLVAGFFSMEVFWTLWAVIVGQFLILMGARTYFEKQS